LRETSLVGIGMALFNFPVLPKKFRQPKKGEAFMNVKSKYAEDESGWDKPKVDHMRGMCGLPYEMFEGPARVDTSQVRGPKFLRRIFELMGWKTKSGQSE
jgi:hypothetical protein